MTRYHRQIDKARTALSTARAIRDNGYKCTSRTRCWKDECPAADSSGGCLCFSSTQWDDEIATLEAWLAVIEAGPRNADIVPTTTERAPGEALGEELGKVAVALANFSEAVEKGFARVVEAIEKPIKPDVIDAAYADILNDEKTKPWTQEEGAPVFVLHENKILVGKILNIFPTFLRIKIGGGGLDNIMRVFPLDVVEPWIKPFDAAKIGMNWDEI